MISESDKNTKIGILEIMYSQEFTHTVITYTCAYVHDHGAVCLYEIADSSLRDPNLFCSWTTDCDLRYFTDAYIHFFYLSHSTFVKFLSKHHAGKRPFLVVI